MAERRWQRIQWQFPTCERQQAFWQGAVVVWDVSSVAFPALAGPQSLFKQTNRHCGFKRAFGFDRGSLSGVRAGRRLSLIFFFFFLMRLSRKTLAPGSWCSLLVPVPSDATSSGAGAGYDDGRANGMCMKKCAMLAAPCDFSVGSRDRSALKPGRSR